MRVTNVDTKNKTLVVDGKVYSYEKDEDTKALVYKDVNGRTIDFGDQKGEIDNSVKKKCMNFIQTIFETIKEFIDKNHRFPIVSNNFYEQLQEAVEEAVCEATAYQTVHFQDQLNELKNNLVNLQEGLFEDEDIADEHKDEICHALAEVDDVRAEKYLITDYEYLSNEVEEILDADQIPIKLEGVMIDGQPRTILISFPTFGMTYDEIVNKGASNYFKGEALNKEVIYEVFGEEDKKHTMAIGEFSEELQSEVFATLSELVYKGNKDKPNIDVLKDYWLNQCDERLSEKIENVKSVVDRLESEGVISKENSETVKNVADEMELLIDEARSVCKSDMNMDNTGKIDKSVNQNEQEEIDRY